MGTITDLLLGRSFVVVARTAMPDDAPTYRPNDQKLIGEAIHIPMDVREELGLRIP